METCSSEQTFLRSTAHPIVGIHYRVCRSLTSLPPPFPSLTQALPVKRQEGQTQPQQHTLDAAARQTEVTGKAEVQFLAHPKKPAGGVPAVPATQEVEAGGLRHSKTLSKKKSEREERGFHCRLAPRWCPTQLAGRKLRSARLGVFLDTFILLFLFKHALQQASLEGGFLSHRQCPWAWPQSLGERLQEIFSPVVYSKPQGWKLRKSEIIVSVLYLAPVSSGDLKAGW